MQEPAISTFLQNTFYEKIMFILKNLKREKVDIAASCMAVTIYIYISARLQNIKRCVRTRKWTNSNMEFAVLVFRLVTRRISNWKPHSHITLHQWNREKWKKFEFEYEFAEFRQDFLDLIFFGGKCRNFCCLL